MQRTVQVDSAEDALMRLMLVAGRRFRARTDGDTVEPAQATLLYVLQCHGSMRLGDIAEAVTLDASTVSRHVQQLGDAGLVDRHPDPEDGRAHLVELTEEGVRSLRRTLDQRRDFLSAALQDWSAPDRERLRADLVRLTASLGATAI